MIYKSDHKRTQQTLIRDHLEKIRYFSAVCEAGTFRKAALQLHLSQSSLTVAVKKLEEAVGTRLLVRTKRGVHTTAAGVTLMAFARELAGRIEDLEVRLRAPGDPLAGRLRIGAYDSIAIYWLPGLVRRIQEQYPQLHLSISIGSSLALVEQLKDEAIDLALVVEPPVEKHLTATKLFDDVFSFFATQRLARELEKEPRASCPTIGMLGARVARDETLGDCLRQRGVLSTGVIEVESFEIAKSLAAQEVGVAVIPHRVADFDRKNSRLVKVKDLPQAFGRHRIALVELQSKERRSHIKAALTAVMLDLAKRGN